MSFRKRNISFSAENESNYIPPLKNVLDNRSAFITQFLAFLTSHIYHTEKGTQQQHRMGDLQGTWLPLLLTRPLCHEPGAELAYNTSKTCMSKPEVSTQLS